MDNTNLENSPELIKSNDVEAEARYGAWTEAMSAEDVPKFAGEGAEFFGDSTQEPTENLSDVAAETENEYDQGLADAAAIINYGLDAAARRYGVEAVIQGIKSFDASGSDNPIRDLYRHLGIDTVEESKDLHNVNDANKVDEAEFRERTSLPSTSEKSKEGAFKAIEDVKELISDVEGADPRYNDLRMGARQAGKGYFEYAVDSLEKRGLTDLFGVLQAQKESVDTESKKVDEETEAEGETPKAENEFETEEKDNEEVKTEEEKSEGEPEQEGEEKAEEEEHKEQSAVNEAEIWNEKLVEQSEEEPIIPEAPEEIKQTTVEGTVSFEQLNNPNSTDLINPEQLRK